MTLVTESQGVSELHGQVTSDVVIKGLVMKRGACRQALSFALPLAADAATLHVGSPRSWG